MPLSLRNFCSGHTIGMFSDDNGDDDNYLEKCRNRCRRRIEMRRQQQQSEIFSSGDSISSSSYLGKMESSTSQAAAGPAVGAISIPGRQRVMEDAISIQPNLCSPDINRRRPLDFFAIYDGHGSRHVNPTVASLCRERMHVILEEELMCMRNNVDMGGNSSSHGRQQSLEGQRTEEEWKRALKSCFLRIDEMASCTCSVCGSVGYQCSCPSYAMGLTGSTAVVAVLTDETIIVANCGDSRAVLNRSGSAIPLSYDHKPDRQEERARIEACGGRVVFADGARVEGILAMSRAIGDNFLKPYITSEPEMTFTKREAEDECLILASDGLWDVIPSEMACEVARACLREGAGYHSSRSLDSGSGAVFSSRSASAAALLTRLALGRNSCDNISVIVVDLKRNDTAV